MAGTGTQKEEVHVVMLPWCAFGHMIPFFELSKSLANSGVSVSFVSTPRNIQRLPKLPPNLEALVKLIELPMPRLGDGLLPRGAEATVDLPSLESAQYLKIAYDLLREPFKEYVAGAKADWIIADVLPHWAADVAAEVGIPLMVFSVFSAATMLFLGGPHGQTRLRGSPESLTVPPEWVPFPSTVAFRGFEAAAMHRALYEDNASGISDSARFVKLWLACRAVSVRSCHEVEHQYLSSLGEVIGRDVIPVGLLLPDQTTGRAKDEEWSRIFRWLDNQKDKSVVFVGFGSECKLTKEQVLEIAHGLELSELPFLWVLRRPNWAVGNADALPEGFTDRTARRGIVNMGWAPQMEILGHRAIGGSLFHSGWGSIIETLQFGHTLVVLPLVIEQGLNARFLVESGLAVEIQRSDDGSFCGESVAECLRVAMVGEQGEALRAKARKAASIFGDKKLQQRYINAFVNYLKRGI